MDTLIFDFDGTIVDSKPIHEKAFVSVFQEIGIDFLDAKIDWFGKSTASVFQEITTHFGISLSKDMIQDLSNMKSLIARERVLSVKPNQNILKVLELFMDGLDFRILSNSKIEGIEAYIKEHLRDFQFTSIDSWSGSKFDKNDQNALGAYFDALNMSGGQIILIDDSKEVVDACIKAGRVGLLYDVYMDVAGEIGNHLFPEED